MVSPDRSNERFSLELQRGVGNSVWGYTLGIIKMDMGCGTRSGPAHINDLRRTMSTGVHCKIAERHFEDSNQIYSDF